MQNNSKNIKEIFRTGNKSLIASSIYNYFKSQNFYKKVYTGSTFQQSKFSDDSVNRTPAIDNDIIAIAEEVFNVKGDFTERSATPKETESLQIPMAG